MYDESRYLSCCQCFAVVLRDDAVRTPELHGAFCSEACAFLCMKINNPPRDPKSQFQAGDKEAGPMQINDLDEWPTMGWQQV
ncbi:MAG: hypothetical protein WAT81_02190 [Candidatus Moraniibacteriota bacterium]